MTDDDPITLKDAAERAAVLRSYAAIFDAPRRDPISRAIIPATEACKAAAAALRFQAAALEDATDDPAQDLYDAYQRLAEADR